MVNSSLVILGMYTGLGMAYGTPASFNVTTYPCKVQLYLRCAHWPLVCCALSRSLVGVHLCREQKMWRLVLKGVLSTV
jgi:hypothetical protein